MHDYTSLSGRTVALSCWLNRMQRGQVAVSKYESCVCGRLEHTLGCWASLITAWLERGRPYIRTAGGLFWACGCR